MIRRFEEGDIPGVLALRESTADGDADHVPLDADGFRKRFLSRKNHDPEGHLVAVENGEIAGWALAEFDARRAGTPGAAGSLVIEVAPRFAEGALPSEILERAAGYLMSRGASKAMALAERRCAPKRALLEKLGFTLNGYETHIMSKMLAEGGFCVEDPSGISISRAPLPDSVPMLHAVYNAAFATRGKGHLVGLEEFSGLSYFNRSPEEVAVFVARETSEHTPVGFVVCEIEPGDVEPDEMRRGMSFSLSVVPAFRGRGLGTALMARTLGWLESRGVSEALLRVNWHNDDAVHIYKRLGYRSIIMRLGYERIL